MLRIITLGAFIATTLVLGASGAERVVAYRIVDAASIPASLTGAPGDAAAGRDVYFGATLGGCAVCHGDPATPGGNAAPALGGLAARMNTARLRLWIVAPEVIEPGTEMPGYYAVGQRTDPTDPRYGEPRLSAAEIEDLIAFLMTPTR